MMVARFGKDRSSHNAALLLLQVRMIAIDEVRDEFPLPDAESSDSSLLSVSENDQQSFSYPFDAPVPTTEQKVITPQKSRCRTVSLCSQEEFKRNSPSPALASPESVLVEPDSPSSSRNSPASSSGSERFLSKNSRKSSMSAPLPFNPSHKFVCEVVEGPVKATLKKKFSWKSYPELEAYLIDNRSQYMRYSSQLNYTAEQKKYNNALTQGLLELASQEGYRFEGFTFAAIRDRIRCYYKSYVQATKKRKRRRSK